MNDPSSPDRAPEAVIAACFADLAANAPPEGVLARLRAISAQLGEQSPLRPGLLRAQAIAKQRLGYSQDALGDLHEARRLLEACADRHALAEVFHAIAVIHSWRGDGREAALALVRAVAEGTAANDRTVTALAFIEAGRLQIEIGRPRDAVALLAVGLDASGTDLPARERDRAGINLVQALVAAGRFADAEARLDEIVPALHDPHGRPRLLVEIERARIAQGLGDRTAALQALEAAASLLTKPQSFSRVELAHAQAEVNLATGDAATAEPLLNDVVSRYAADDLAGREVVARLLQAQAFDALGRAEDADRTLAAALRRALARGLVGHADEARARIAARGGVEGAWVPGEPPSGSARSDAAQRFVRRRPLGEGGFGNVWRAYDLELGIEVALKRTSLKDIYDPAVRSRLLAAARTEIAAAARIEHPGAARIHGMLIDQDGDALLVQEFIEGPTLRAAMSNPAKSMEQARALDLLSRIAFALAAIHAAGIVHRDLKPENVVLRGGASPVIVDFGVALIGRGHDATGGVGTVSYRAPEQARGRTTDARADLYSLGVIAHELITASRPVPLSSGVFPALTHLWRRRSMGEKLLAVGIEPDIADLVVRLLAPAPWQRPRSAALVGAPLAEAASRMGQDFGSSQT